MATRNIKDAKDLNTGELIYFKGHAQATFMSDGRTVEEAINSNEGNSSSDSAIEYIDVFGLENVEYIDDYNNIEASATITYDDYVRCRDAVERGKLGLAWDYLRINNVYWEELNSNWFRVLSVFYDEGYNILRWIAVGFNSELTIWAQSGIVEVGSSSGGSEEGITSIKINGINNSPSNGEVDLGYINKLLSTTTSSSMTLSPNIYYRNTSTSLSSLTITLGSVSNSNIINEYFVEFTTRSSGTTVSLPSTIKWVNGEKPTFEASTTYLISIVNNLGVVTKFK